MPIYEYNCPNCGRFELKQSMKDSKLESCPTCSAPVQRLISKNVGIIFKAVSYTHLPGPPALGGDRLKRSPKA